MKKLFLLVLLMSGFMVVSAQDTYNSSGTNGSYYKRHNKHSGYDPSKLVIGGGINLAYSTDYANFGLSPIVGYHFTKGFIAGVSMGYQYYMQQITWTDGSYQKVTENIFNGSIWAKQFIHRNVYATATLEYDAIALRENDATYDYYSGNLVPSQLSRHVSATCLLIGVGVKEPIAGRVSAFIELVYDVLQQPYSPYFGQPIFNAGFAAGF